MALTAAERETIISISDADDRLHIQTGQRPMITKLKRNPSFELEREYTHEGNTILSGFLPPNALSIRNPKGAASRVGTRKAPNVARCGEPKADGSTCQAFAMKGTGKCRHHSPKE